MSSDRPKIFNLYVDSGVSTTLSSAYNAFFRAAAGTFTLPPISEVPNGASLVLKHTGSTGNVVFQPAGTDTINGGAGTQSVTVTSGGAGAGEAATVVAVKNGGTSSWWVVVKPQ